MNVKMLSQSYVVRKLELSNVDDIYALCKENIMYYRYCPPFVSKESIIQDMCLTPKNVALQDKYYVGFYKENKLICLMDLIDHYPYKNTVYIGFFMVNKKYQNQGIGSKIIRELFCTLSKMGYKKVNLAWVNENKQSENFWLKNGMKVIKQIRSDSVGQVVKLAEKNIWYSQKM